MNKQNIFSEFPAPCPGELFQTLLETGSFRLERISSAGHASPPGHWYDQDRDEWVMLVSGKAALLFEGEPQALVLAPGDHLLIPAHCRHRVEWTASGIETVWLALHFDPS